MAVRNFKYFPINCTFFFVFTHLKSLTPCQGFDTSESRGKYYAIKIHIWKGMEISFDSQWNSKDSSVLRYYFVYTSELFVSSSSVSRRRTGTSLISNFRHVVKVVFFPLGDSPASECYVPTFCGTLCVFHLRIWNTQSVPKYRHIKFRSQGIAQNKEYNIRVFDTDDTDTR